MGLQFNFGQVHKIYTTLNSNIYTNVQPNLMCLDARVYGVEEMFIVSMFIPFILTCVSTILIGDKPIFEQVLAALLPNILGCHGVTIPFDRL